MAITAATLMVRVGADTSEAESKISSFRGRMDQAAKRLGVTGGLLSAGVTLPLAAIGRQALQSAGEFEQAMNVLAVVANVPANAMQQLQQEALRLGAVTSFSAGEAAQAMLELGKAGMNADQIMASIGGVLDLAAAGGVSLAEAANITTAALNSFGLAASESSWVANLLAAAANASTADISDLAYGLQQGGFAFAAAGQQVDDLVASLAILTNVGLTGSDAGTALKNAFIRIIDPTKEAKGVMDALGISFFDAQGNMLPLADIIDILNTSMAGMSQEQRLAALSTIFLSDGAKAMIPLLDAGKEGFLQMKEAVNQAGAAAQAANARMSGLSGAVEYFRGSVDSALISVASRFLPTLSALVRFVADLITQFTELPQPIQNAALAFGAVLAAAGPLLLALSGVAAAISFLLSPIGLVVAAVAGLAAAWAANFGGIQEKTQAVIDFLRPGFTELLSWIQAAMAGDFEPLKQGLTDTIGQIQSFDWGTWAENVRTSIGEAFSNFQTGLVELGTKATELRDNVIETATTTISGIDWSDVSLDISGFVNRLAGAINGIDWASFDPLGAVTGFLGRLTGSVTTAVGGLTWEDITGDKFNGLVSAITTAIGEFDWSAVALSFGNLKTAVVNAITAIDWGGSLEDTSLSSSLGTLRDNVVTALSDKIQGMDITGALAGILNSLTTGINNIDFSTVGAAVAKAVSTALDPETITTAASNMASAIQSAITTAIGAIAWSTDSANFDKLKSAVITAITNIDWTTVGESFTALKNAIVNALGDFASGFTEAFETPEWLQKLLNWSWPALPKFEWPALPQWRWPDIPVPAWVETLFSGDWWPDVSLPDLNPFNATGSQFFRGGLTWVGERGPELVALPRGSRIFSNRESMELVGSGGPQIIVNATLNNDLDVEELAYRIARVIQRRQR